MWPTCMARLPCGSTVGAAPTGRYWPERLRLARSHGATLALVKGRTETSGPILLRAGFAEYDEERSYWLPVV